MSTAALTSHIYLSVVRKRDFCTTDVFSSSAIHDGILDSQGILFWNSYRFSCYWYCMSAVRRQSGTSRLSKLWYSYCASYLRRATKFCFNLGAAKLEICLNWERSETTNSVCVYRHKRKFLCSKPVS
jgi:hypothetical protein